MEICCDVSEENLNKIKSLYGNTQTTNNIDDVLNNENINGVVISTPAVTHYDLAKKALMNGKHVFVEKPLSLKISEAEELVKISNEKKKILMVGNSAKQAGWMYECGVKLKLNKNKAVCTVCKKKYTLKSNRVTESK